MGHPFLEAEVRKLYKLLAFNETNLAEVRCVDIVGKSGVVSRELLNTEDAFAKWARAHNGLGNCFVGRNPRNQDKEVSGIHTVSLDIDPVRPKGEAASAEQTEEAINAGMAILDVFKGGSIGFSGNGCLVIWGTNSPILDQAEFKGFELRLKAFQDECQKQFDPGRIKIDATQDSPRLLKLLGTVSVKGGVRLTRFIRMASSRGDGDALFQRLGKALVEQPAPRGELLARATSDDRSRNDFALASHYQRQGLSPYDILEALAHHALGRPERKDDHIRIVEKLCAVVWNGGGFESRGVVPGHASPGTPVPSSVVHSPGNSFELYLDGLDKRGKQETVELQVGFKEFDNATNGLRRGELYTVAARPGVGKTSLLINIALGLSSVGKSVLFLSTEMSYQDIWDRALSIGTDIPGQAFLLGKFTDIQRQQLASYGTKFKDYRFKVCDSFQPKIESVEAAVKEHVPDILVFDHIQHIEGGEDWKTISAFTQGLKRIAMEQKIAVLVASQLRRPSQSVNLKTGDVVMARPTMNDLKGCGRIEEESAFIMLLHPTGLTFAEDCPIIRAELVKNRYGPNVISDMVFFRNITKFKSLEGLNVQN